MVESLSTPAQWGIILFTFYITYSLVKDHVRPHTTRFWTLFVTPIWFSFVYGTAYYMYAIVHLAVTMQFADAMTLVALAVVMVLIPAPLNYYLHDYALGERRAGLIAPLALGTWGWFFSILIPVLGMMFAGVSLDDDE